MIVDYVRAADEERTTRTPNWIVRRDGGVYGGYEVHSNVAGELLETRVRGTYIEALFVKGPNRGFVEVFIDEKQMADIDLYDPNWSQVWIPLASDYTFLKNQPSLEHVVRLRVKGAKNPNSTDYYVVVLAFRGLVRTTILELATRNSSGVSEAFDVAGIDKAILMVKVTEVSGTSPTLDITVEGFDGEDWFPLYAMPTISAVGNYSLKMDNLGHQVRLRYTLGGTSPSFTFYAKLVGV
jgi:hypothetical protein